MTCDLVTETELGLPVTKLSLQHAWPESSEHDGELRGVLGRSLKCSSFHKFYHDPHEWNQTKGVSNFGISLGTSWWGVTGEMPGPHGDTWPTGDVWLTCEHIEFTNSAREKRGIIHGVNQSSSESKVKPKSSKSNMYTPLTKLLARWDVRAGCTAEAETMPKSIHPFQQ